MGKLRLNPSQRNNKNNSHNKSKLGVVVGGIHKNNNNKNKSKAASLKNQIRSTQRFLKRDLPADVRETQEKKLEELMKQQSDQNRLAEERRIFLRDRKIKFFERRKIERRIRRMEKQQRVSSNEEEKKIAEELRELKNDLEYVRFFPKTEKYVPLFCGDDNSELMDNRNRLRMLIKANIIAAAASGKDLEETGSEDDGPIDLTDDDFFVSGTSSDEADADDELTDLSAREPASSVPTNAALGMSSDETNKKSAQTLMPPPRPRPQRQPIQKSDNSTSRNSSKIRKISHSNDGGFRHSHRDQSSNKITKPDFSKQSNDSRFRHGQAGRSSNKTFTKPSNGSRFQHGESSNRFSKPYTPTQSNDRGFRHSQAGQSSNKYSKPDMSIARGFRNAQAGPSRNSSYNSDTPMQSIDMGFPNSQVSQSSNISSNSDAPKKPRKRRPKKRKQ